MPLNLETRQTLFSDLHDEFPEDMDQPPIQSWDVMDLFPPIQSWDVMMDQFPPDQTGDLESHDQAVSLASPHEVHSEGGASTVLRRYVQILLAF
jgi:hypothetical protein